MPVKNVQGFYFITAISLFVGYLVAVFPLPQQFVGIRPELICLLVFYWIITAPEMYGVVFAWSAGLLQDIIEGTVWGGHAMALSVIAYACLMSYQRMRNYSVWHQAFWMFVLVGAHQVIVNWVQGLAGYTSPTFLILLPAVVSALSWPLVVAALRKLQFRYRLL